jgi:hypothetical protein
MKGFIFSLLVATASSLPNTVKRQVGQLRNSYDFIIAGGGTCGLTVADRLTEAFPDSKYTTGFSNTWKTNNI